MARILRQPAFPGQQQPVPLPAGQGEGGLGEAGPGLHLDKGEQPVPFGDEVELAGRGAAALC